MKITVIGRGNVGGGLARLWRQAGHDVTELGKDGGDASDADVILVAVPSAAIARPTPVLPEVGSTIVPPGRSFPSSSAASIIARPMRSLFEPPGFMYSSFARSVAGTSSEIRGRRTMGVPPISSRTVGYLRAIGPGSVQGPVSFLPT